MHRGSDVNPAAPVSPGRGEISREALVGILEIMDRLSMPEELPELLREIIEVGRIAIIAEAGVLWLYERQADELVMVVPTGSPPQRIRPDSGLPGAAVASRSNINLSEGDDGFEVGPLSRDLTGCEARSLLTVPVLGQDDSLLGVMQWVGEHAGQFDRHDEWIAPALAAQAAIAIQHSRFTDQLLADAILRQEVAVAREIQVSTLPRRMPEVAGYELAGKFLPTDHTGGDLYDLVVLDGRLFMLLGDATGHGFGPALSATQMQAMLRLAFRLGADLDTAYTQVNNQLSEDLPADRFITAFIGFLDPACHEVRYHSGGQGPILHFRASDGGCDWHKPTSFPLGAMAVDSMGEAASLTLAAGDILALISDGIYEYANRDGAHFGEDGVARILREHRHEPLPDLAQRLVDAAIDFGSDIEQADDITLVLVRRVPDNAKGGV